MLPVAMPSSSDLPLLQSLIHWPLPHSSFLNCPIFFDSLVRRLFDSDLAIELIRAYSLLFITVVSLLVNS